MKTALSLIGMAISILLMYKREQIGNMIGETAFMRKVGGVYNFIVIVSVILFLWSIAEITGTTDVLFSPIKNLFPQFRTAAQPDF